MRDVTGKYFDAVTLNDLADEWRRFAAMEKRVVAKLAEDDPHSKVTDETRRHLKRSFQR